MVSLLDKKVRIYSLSEENYLRKVLEKKQWEYYLNLDCHVSLLTVCSFSKEMRGASAYKLYLLLPLG